MGMTSAEISAMLSEALPSANIEVQGGDGKFEVVVISEIFDGLNRVKRQQAIYRFLNEHIGSGAIHAVTMILKTPAEAAA